MSLLPRPTIRIPKNGFSVDAGTATTLPKSPVPNIVMNQDNLLDQLKHRLTQLTQEAGGLAPVFSLAELNTPEDVAAARAILAKTGVLFVTGALPASQKTKIRDRIVASYNQMFAADGVETVTQIEQIPQTMKAGIVGNKSFGYLYKQLMTKASTFTMNVDGNGNPVYMSQNPVYTGVNLSTMCDPENRKLLSVLLALTHSKNVMISWDSVKVANNFKSGANPFTCPHVDYYQNRVDRYQAILNPIEERTKLFYAPYTGDPVVRDLIAKIQNDPNLYQKDGFKKITDDVFEVIRPFMRAAPPGSLSIWRSGIVHAEQTGTYVPSPEDGLYRPDPVCRKQLIGQMTVRLVVGTHKPVGLTNFAKKQLAVAAQRGVIPSRYQHGKHYTVVENKMHKGKTLYRKSRPQPASERALLESVSELLQNSAEVELAFEGLDPITKHISGIDQPIWPELAELLD